MPKKKRVPAKLQPWLEARRRHRLSHAHVQMARELGMNPRKLGKIDNHRQQPWKAPLPVFIEKLYRKRFGRDRPEVVRSIEEIVRRQEAKRQRKRERRQLERVARLTTERLELHPFSNRHLDILHTLWTDPDVRRYLWDDRLISRQEAAGVIDFSRSSFETHGFGFWLLTRRDGGEPAGFAGFRRFGDGDEIEILYGLFPSSWGQGLASEAARQVLRFAFEDLELAEIFAGADPPNTSSFRVMERLGFVPHGRRVIDGVETDYYVVTREQFLRPSPARR